MARLHDLIKQFETDSDSAQSLLGAFHRHIRHVTSSYPDAYFELGQRTPEALDGLANRTMSVCARVKKGRFPFSGRTPFLTYVQERLDDPPIRYHSFYAKLSIARELLRNDYAFNIRRNPRLRWKDKLHRQIGVILKEDCCPASDDPSSRRLWRSKNSGLTVVSTLDQVQQRLQAYRSEDTRVLVAQALRISGQPMSHSSLTNLIADIVGGPPANLELEPDTQQQNLPDVFVIRQAVVDAWEDLTDDEKCLIAALIRGQSYDDLIETTTRFRDRGSISRAVKRCGDQFVVKVLEAMGVTTAKPEATPKEIIERVAHVLLPLLPELTQSGGPS